MKIGFTHPSAVVEYGAEIHPSVEIGPFCYISSKAKIGPNCRLISNVTIFGDTTLGEENVIYPGACLGGGAQEHSYNPTDNARLIIGNHNIIRENVTMHAGTLKGQTSVNGESPQKFITYVGSYCLFMVNSHVAHDCVVENFVTMANNAVIGGHVRVGNGVVIGGNSAVHQFVRIGDGAMIGGVTGIAQDVIPFGMAAYGTPGKLKGLNLVGLKRNHYDEAIIKEATRAYMYLFSSKEGTFKTRVQKATTEFADNEIVQLQIKFIEQANHSPRHLLMAE